jgi:hypothetical protein
MIKQPFVRVVFLVNFFLLKRPRLRKAILYFAKKTNLLGPVKFMRRRLSIATSDAPYPQMSFMGQQVLSLSEWREKLAHAETENIQVRRNTFNEESHVSNVTSSSENPRAAVITSLYNSDNYIEMFLDNLISQDSFNVFEFHLVLVQPSEKVTRLVFEASTRFTNVRFKIIGERIGIYQAWNISIGETSAPLITNANDDDIRKKDSIIHQVNMLERYEWIDVLYQDVFLSYDYSTDWEALELIGNKVKMNHVTYAGLILSGLNYPHHAPMWRRSLHEELGLFDEAFKSAGDYEFWVRCASKNKTFFKSSYTHAGYFLNPNGISTGTDSLGARELAEIQKKYQILSPSRHQIDSSRSTWELFSNEYNGKLNYTNHNVLPEKITKKFIAEVQKIRNESK